MFYAIIARGPKGWYVTSDKSDSPKKMLKANNNVEQRSVVIKVDDIQGLLKALMMVSKFENTGQRVRQGIYDLTSKTIKAQKLKIQEEGTA